MSNKELLEEPNVKWTPWKLWKKRRDLEGICHSNGVYLLARFPDSASTEVAPDPCAEEIVYIGETCDQHIEDRLNAFRDSAFCGVGKHRGGTKYAKGYRAGFILTDESLDALIGKLPDHVLLNLTPLKGVVRSRSGLEQDIAELLRPNEKGKYLGLILKQARSSGEEEPLYVSVYLARYLGAPPAFIRYLERKLLWDYYRRWHQLPACNSK